jgi:peptidoglycan-associated lipoprotein
VSSTPVSSETNSEERSANYYKGTPNAVPAIQVETVSGLFYTVQVGVYSKPVPSASLKNISPVNSELTSTKKIRYTSGIYNNLQAAVDQRNQAKGLGINDAFITAYYNGKRITLSEADRLIKENGNTILVK